MKGVASWSRSPTRRQTAFLIRVARDMLRVEEKRVEVGRMSRYRWKTMGTSSRFRHTLYGMFCREAQQEKMSKTFPGLCSKYGNSLTPLFLLWKFSQAFVLYLERCSHRSIFITLVSNISLFFLTAFSHLWWARSAIGQYTLTRPFILPYLTCTNMVCA